MRLQDYAKSVGVCYKTAWLWWRAGKLKGRQLDTGTIIVDYDEPEKENAVNPVKAKIAVYGRVSSSENRGNLETQVQRLLSFANAKGLHVDFIVKGIGSGLNDERPKLEKILTNNEIKIIIVEHKDRLTRFGFNYIEKLLKMQGREIIVINPPNNDKEDLMGDFVSVITSFCARLYGQRRTKRQTEKIIAELEKNSG